MKFPWLSTPQHVCRQCGTRHVFGCHENLYRKPVLSKTDSKNGEEHLAVINTDSILNGMTSGKVENAEYNRNATFFAHVGLEHEELYDEKMTATSAVIVGLA